MRIAPDHLLIGGLWLALAVLVITALLGWVIQPVLEAGRA